MLALKIQPGRITSQTVVINDELAYVLTLSAQRFGYRPFIFEIVALTLLGKTIVTHERFADLATARQAYHAYLTDLAQK